MNAKKNMTGASSLTFYFWMTLNFRQDYFGFGKWDTNSFDSSCQIPTEQRATCTISPSIDFHLSEIMLHQMLKSIFSRARAVDSVVLSVSDTL